MEVDENVWNYIQKHLGYTDEEMIEFKADSRNTDVLSKGLNLMNKIIIIEVVESHGCNSNHSVGDTFYFDGAENLLTALFPKRVCGYYLNSASMMVFSANDSKYRAKQTLCERFFLRGRLAKAPLSAVRGKALT